MKKETMYTNLCKLKQRVDFEECKDVVYSVPCMKCDVRYLGETGQHFCERRKQHEMDIKNRKAFLAFMNTAEETKDISRIGARQCLWREKSTGWPGR